MWETNPVDASESWWSPVKVGSKYQLIYNIVISADLQGVHVFYTPTAATFLPMHLFFFGKTCFLAHANNSIAVDRWGIFLIGFVTTYL